MPQDTDLLVLVEPPGGIETDESIHYEIVSGTAAASSRAAQAPNRYSLNAL